MSLFNRLTPEAKDVSTHKFEEVIRNWLTREAFYSVDEFFYCKIELSFVAV
jgi:hypothetical protein